MKKTYIILICIIVALISGIIGFAIGLNINLNNNSSTTTQIEDKEDSLVGTYKTNTWNGKEGIIALQKDKTMICPNGNGTWIFEEGKLYIEYDSLWPEYTEDGHKENKTVHSKQEVLIVENGLMLSGHFFEKVK